jgi:Tat protein secretion system quality control protein TatD with DNase activity
MAKSNKLRWKLYLAQTDQTHQEAVETLIRYTKWGKLLDAIGLHPLQANSKSFFKDRAREVGWFYNVDTSQWYQEGDKT